MGIHQDQDIKTAVQSCCQIANQAGEVCKPDSAILSAEMIFLRFFFARDVFFSHTPLHDFFFAFLSPLTSRF